MPREQNPRQRSKGAVALTLLLLLASLSPSAAPSVADTAAVTLALSPVSPAPVGLSLATTVGAAAVSARKCCMVGTGMT